MGGKLTTIKRIRKCFLLFDYEKEEQYLTKMHAEGWRFVDTNGYCYTFEKCEPEQIAYRIDFSGIPVEQRDDYNAMFRDYGWEYIQDINGFSYFRKPAAGVRAEDLEIFSDGQSRIDMMGRILKNRMLPLFLLMLILVIPQLLRLVREVRAGDTYTMNIVLLSVYIVLFLLYSYLLIRCLLGWLRMKKKYQNGA